MLDVLVVDDDDIIRRSVADALTHAGHQVTEASDGQCALDLVEGHEFDIAICDVQMPKMDGLTLFRRLRRERPATAVVIMTSFGKIGDVVGTLRDGAVDYVTKPFDPDEFVINVVGPIAERRSRFKDFEQARNRLMQRKVGATLVGASLPIRQLADQIAVVAKGDASVLVTGERGSGKKLVAQMLHAASPRRDGPIVEVACATLPASSLDVDWRPWSGDDDDPRTAWLRAAEGGTLVLDGIDELSLTAQASLVRLLQQSGVRARRSREWQPLGVRVVALTRADVSELVDGKRLLETLLLRISTIQLRVPALRERRGDLYLLVAHLLHELTPARRVASDLTPRAWRAIFAHDFPGNIGELARALERALTMADGRPIDLDHLPADIVSDR